MREESRHSAVLSCCSLLLSIYTPSLSPATPLPVMVWIPGGGFVVGSASQADWDPSLLLDRGVVFVTLQYRLGSLGFLALPASTSIGIRVLNIEKKFILGNCV